MRIAKRERMFLLSAPDAIIDAERRLGDAGGVSVAIERIAGAAFESAAVEGATIRSRTIGAFASAGPIGAHNSVRIAADFFPVRGLALGGIVGFVRQSADFDEDAESPLGTSRSTPMPTVTQMLVGARVGFAFEAQPWLAVWPRAAAVLARSQIAGQGVDIQHDQLSVGTEVALVASVVEHVAVSLGPAFDIDVARELSTPTGSTEQPKAISFGFYAGAGAWF